MSWNNHIGHIISRLREMGGYVPAEECSTLAEALARFIASEFQQMKEMIMSLQPQVQALLDAVAANGAAIAAATAEITTVESNVADLTKQVADLQAQLANGQAIDAEDLAAIVQATSDVNTSVGTLKAAMPQPVPPATAQAAADGVAAATGAA